MGIPAVFRFIVHDGGIIKLGEGVLKVSCMKERMGEDLVENQDDNILTPVNMEGGEAAYCKSALLTGL